MKLFIDMDGVLCDFDKAHSENLKTSKFPQRKPGFFLGLEPIPFALESIYELLSLPVELFILTAPSTRNPHCWGEKAQWVEKHLGFNFLSRMIITERKDLLFNILDYSFLVDDCDAGKGQEVWAKNNALLKFGSNEHPDWRSIVSFTKYAVKYGNYR